MAVTGTTVLGGRYTLVAVLGTGGMATVWRARDETLGRDVAVKVLSPQHAADPGFLARFEGEARHAAAVSHPRLVTVFDCGVEDGTPFIVMELVAGRTLRQVLDEAGALPPGQAVAIAAAVCEGLEAAHAAGLVHRDITPGNIVLNGGEVKVLDFGIARADGTRAATAAGTVVGTVAYLSPEQASGRQDARWRARRVAYRSPGSAVFWRRPLGRVRFPVRFADRAPGSHRYRAPHDGRHKRAARDDFVARCRRGRHTRG